MISIAQVVEELVNQSPNLAECLEMGIINYTALSRRLRPEIEKKLIKKVSRESIVMSLKRLSAKLGKKRNTIKQFVHFKGLTVRSGLAEYTYLNSDQISLKNKRIFQISEKRNEIFCNLSTGVRESMIIISSELSEEIERIFIDERLIAKITNLSSITLLLSKETISIPGVYASILKLLAWHNIKIIDIVSTYSELTIIFEDQVIDRAFSILKNYENSQL